MQGLSASLGHYLHSGNALQRADKACSYREFVLSKKAEILIS